MRFSISASSAFRDSGKHKHVVGSFYNVQVRLGTLKATRYLNNKMAPPWVNGRKRTCWIWERIIARDLYTCSNTGTFLLHLFSLSTASAHAANQRIQRPTFNPTTSQPNLKSTPWEPAQWRVSQSIPSDYSIAAYERLHQNCSQL